MSNIYAEYLADFLFDQTGIKLTFSHKEGDKYVFLDPNSKVHKVTAPGS